MTYQPVTWIEKAVYDKAAVAWGWLEVNGWYTLGGLVVFLIILPHIQRFMRSLRSKAYAPSADKMLDFQERQRLARRRQEEQAKKAAEEHAEYERERRARQAEELAAMATGLRNRSGGRRLGSGDGEDVAGSPPPKPKPKKKDSGEDPFRRLRDRNPLGPDTSRGYAPPRRKVNTGG